MGRKLVVGLTGLIIFIATQASALGLGDITVESNLNQPLTARVELLQLGDVRPEDVRVQLASASDFERFSLQRPFFLESIRFRVESSGSRAYVVLTTPEPVREPYLSFVLEARWPNGRLLNEYTVLLDLPVFADQSSSQAAQPPVGSRSVQPASETTGQSTGTQQTSSSAAPSQQEPARLAAASGEQDEQALDPLNEQTDDQSNGQPGEESASGSSGEAARRQIGSDQTVTVENADTLWDIALDVRPDRSISVQQTMLALQRLNEDAFIGNNINMVRRGQVLRVPDLQEIQTLSFEQAVSEVGRQNQLFTDRRNAPLSSEPLSAPPSGSGTSAGTGRGELSVVSSDPQDAADADASSSAAARIAELENRLAVSNEEIDRITLQNEELTARISMLEEQIASSQELLRLRDLELAQLQSQLAEQNAAAAQPEPPVAADPTADPAAGEPVGSEPVAQPVEEPTVVTMAPEEGTFSRIMGALIANTWALLALVLLVIIALVVMLRRNRAESDYDRLETDEREADSPVAAQGAALYASRDEDDAQGTAAYGAASYDTPEAELAEAQVETETETEIEAEIETQTQASGAAAASSAVAAGAALSWSAADDAAQADQQPAADDTQILDEAEALLAYQRYSEARTLLQDAIVAEPNRSDLRLKLLEVHVASQDVMGFRLQEAELLKIADSEDLARIDQLRDELPQDPDADQFGYRSSDDEQYRELSQDEELELELDLEASAEVDDARVLSSLTADDVDANDVGSQAPNDDPDDGFDFDLEDTEGLPAHTEAERVSDDSDEFVLDDQEESGGLSDPLQDLDFDFEVDDDQTGSPAEIESLEVRRDARQSAAESAADQASDLAQATADAEAQDFNAGSTPGSEAAGLETTGFDATDTARDDRALDMDFSLDELELEDTDAAEPVQEPRDNAIDFDMPEAPGSGSDVDSALEGDLASIEFTSEDFEAADVEIDPLEEDEFAFLSDTDEAATKLDLARAYIDMGDKEGAREILQEVLQEGNEAQISDARTLLERV